MEEKKLPSWQRLRADCDPPRFSDYEVPPEAERAFKVAMGDYILGGINGLWYEPESREGISDLDQMAYVIGSRASALCQLYNGPSIGSPIESQLLAALLWLNVDWAGFPIVDGIGAFDRNEEATSGGVNFFITPQAKIAGFKVDAAVWFQCGRERGGIAVECDGHNYHDRTKEQAARDKSRDRAILAAGFPVMRFTGSEIFRDVMACVAQVQEVASEILFRVSKEGGLM